MLRLSDRTWYKIFIVMFVVAVAICCYTLLQVGSEGGQCIIDPLGYYLNNVEGSKCFCHGGLEMVGVN